LPGVQDPDQVKSVIGRTAKLTFQLLCENQPTTPARTRRRSARSLPQKDTPDQPLWVQTSSRATVEGADLVDARGAFDQQNNPVVSFRFNTKGAERFARLTRDNVGRPFAIILDDEIVSAPRINEPILGGSGQISGNFTVQETNDLADRAALGRASRQAHHRGRAHRGPEPWFRFDPRRRHRRDHRPRPRHPSVHSAALWPVRNLRQYRADREPGDADRPSCRSSASRSPCPALPASC
jgi:hypothetical protein